MAKEKMSKSRGNVITVDEVVNGIYEVDSRYEFRDQTNKVIDWKERGVWRDRERTGYYFMSSRYKLQPAFLHCKDNPVPCLLLINSVEQVQHSKLSEFWENLLNKYEESSSP